MVCGEYAEWGVCAPDGVCGTTEWAPRSFSIHHRAMPSPLLAFFFSNPFAALVTAAGAVAVPVIIHLLHRKRFRVVPWAAMRFLLAAQKKNTRRLRLEQLLLLILRAT